jgi:ATP synthase H subunit
MDKILKSIRESESRARDIIEQARKSSEKIIAEAKDKAQHLLKNAESQTSSQTHEILSKKNLKIDEEKKRIAQEGKGSVQKIEKASSPNISKSADFVMKKFEEEIKNA